MPTVSCADSVMIRHEPVMIRQIYYIRKFGPCWTSRDTLAEWLRRTPAKCVGIPSAGSNPAGVELFAVARRAVRKRFQRTWNFVFCLKNPTT